MHPYDPQVQDILEESCKELGYKYHPKGTTITIEGPRFSTLAESRLYQSWGCDIVNMTAVPEAQLAAEAGLIYASLALVTDYDCWHEDEQESVSVNLVAQRMELLGEKARAVLHRSIEKMKAIDWSAKLKMKETQAKEAIMHR